MYVRKNGGETVCSTKTQVIDYDLFFWLHNILRHILPHIKIRVAGAVSPSDLDFIEGGGEQDEGARCWSSLAEWHNELIDIAYLFFARPIPTSCPSGYQKLTWTKPRDTKHEQVI